MSRTEIDKISSSAIFALGGSGSGKGVTGDESIASFSRAGVPVVRIESGQLFRNLKRPVGESVTVGYMYDANGQIHKIDHLPTRQSSASALQADKGEMVETLDAIVPQMVTFFGEANVQLGMTDEMAIWIDGLVRLQAFEHKGRHIPHQIDQISDAWSRAGTSLSQDEISTALFKANFVLVDAHRDAMERQIVGRIENEIARVSDPVVLAGAEISIIRGIVEGTVSQAKLGDAMQALAEMGYALKIRTDDAIHSAREARLDSWQRKNDLGGQISYSPGKVARTAIALGFQMDSHDGSFRAGNLYPNRDVISNRGTFDQLKENARAWSRKWMVKRSLE